MATDQQTAGPAATLVIDRVTASRLGITPQMIDDTLYDAFGQRQISTLFTQLNQYHVVLETMPDFQKNPAKLNDIYVRSALRADLVDHDRHADRYRNHRQRRLDGIRDAARRLFLEFSGRVQRLPRRSLRPTARRCR